MITDDPSSTAMFRLGTKNAIVFVHIRKRCSCGRQTTDRQQHQYGKCVTCVRAETSKG